MKKDLSDLLFLGLAVLGMATVIGLIVYIAATKLKPSDKPKEEKTAALTTPTTARFAGDLIVLANGSEVRGAITREDDSKVQVEVEGGSVSFRRDEIKEIVRGSTDTKKAWAEQQKQAEAKGLVEYKGTWLTPDQRAARLAQEREEYLARKAREAPVLRSKSVASTSESGDTELDIFGRVAADHREPEGSQYWASAREQQSGASGVTGSYEDMQELLSQLGGSE
jgi:hypothetical protein